MVLMDCEFCQELRQPKTSRFHGIYGGISDHRVVARRGKLIALPTLGQIFPGSLLILPFDHVERMAAAPHDVLTDVWSFVSDLEHVIAPSGKTVLFEHGASCATGGGCGIYHAHLHLVPVPGPVLVSDVLPPVATTTLTPAAALDELRQANEYLLFRDTADMVGRLDLSNDAGTYPSQYFRRELARHFGLSQPWDWRSYSHRETWLLDCVELFGTSDVSFSGANS
jgi:diadenosine tetraphosphate (Ap4A) HIT family hydrolase